MTRPVRRMVLLCVTLALTVWGILRADAATYPLIVKDDAGRVVTLTSRPARIVSIGPSTTEIVFAVGAGDRLVGVDRYSDYPPAARRIEHVGGLVDPQVERLVALNPDLILAAPILRVDRLTHFGVPVATIGRFSVEGVETSILLVGRMTDAEVRARHVVETMRRRIRAVREAVRDIPETKRVRVFYELSPDPLRTVGPGSHVHELIELAGGVNIARDTESAWPLYSAEEVIARDPQVIIVAGENSLKELREGDRPAWSHVTAVRTGRIERVEPDAILRPGPRIAEGLEALARTFYPDRFPAEEDP